MEMDDLVYVAKNATVFHLYKNCNYLKGNTVFKISIRNLYKSAKKARLCDACKKKSKRG